MGINGLYPFLKKRVPQAFEKIKLQQLKGTVLAVDASHFLYQAVWFDYNLCKPVVVTVEDGTDTETTKTVHNGHLKFLLNKIQAFSKYNIKPVFVFDGKACDEKGTVLDERRARKEKAMEEIKKIEGLLASEDSGDSEAASDDVTIQDLYAAKKKFVDVSKHHVKDFKVMLRNFNIPYFTSYGEAEKTCSIMASQGIVDGVIADDSDTLPFGTTYVLKDYKDDKKPILKISLKPILKELKLSHKEFVDMCILIGCDFSRPKVTRKYKGDMRTFEKLTPERAYSYIKEHRTLENVISKISHVDYDVEAYTRSRQIFLEPYDESFGKDVIDLKNSYVLDEQRKKDLTKFLIKEHYLDFKKVQSIINKYYENQHLTKDARQSKITSFFTYGF